MVSTPVPQPLSLPTITFLKKIAPGLFELESGAILFARPLRKDGNYREEDDIVESWCLNGCVDLPLPHCLFFFFLTFFLLVFFSVYDIKNLVYIQDLFFCP